MIKLHAFGDIHLRNENGTLLDGIMRQTKRLALLILLACDSLNRPHRREEVISTFWPESDGPRGRNALRQALHVLRDELGPDIIQRNESEDLRVNRAQLSSDVDTFTQAIASGLPEAALAHIPQIDMAISRQFPRHL